MLLGGDARGAVAGDVRAQALQALKNVDAALAAVGSSLGQVVKLNFYFSRDDDAPAVDAVVAELFSDRPVAASWVTTSLPKAEALIGVDAVALAPVKTATVQVKMAIDRPAPMVGASIAVMPAGRRIYVSGQAERDKDLPSSARKTLESLGRTLEWLGLTKADVVQLKAFFGPFHEHRSVVEEIAAFFAGTPIPSCVLVEWTNQSYPIEIELVVSGRVGGELNPDGVGFFTPPGLVRTPWYSRIAIVDPGHPLIYISGLYGQTAGTGRREWMEIFSQLGDILWETGSSMRHQVKGTYYASNGAAGRLRTEVRDVFFDPARPPGSSAMTTRGTGRAGRSNTLDMIAIPIPRVRPAPGQ